MALLKCPECGHMVSDKAAACPTCGCPIEDIRAAQSENKTEKNTTEKNTTEKEKTQTQEAAVQTQEKKPAAPDRHPKKNRKRILAVILAAVVIVAAVFGVRGFLRYRSRHASQLVHDWTFVSLVYTENGEQQDALDTSSFTNAGQNAPTLTVNKDGTYELTALGTEYSGKWTRYSDERVEQLGNVRQAYDLENSQGVQITAMIQNDQVETDNTANAVTVIFTQPSSESSSSGSTQSASADDFYAFLFERTGN